MRRPPWTAGYRRHLERTATGPYLFAMDLYRSTACATNLLPAIVLITAALTACEFKGEPASNAPLPTHVKVWKLEPVSMRIHPSSRFVRGSEQGMLEARVEFLDEMGDSIKAVGRVHIELHARGRSARRDSGRMLYAWDVDLLTLDNQRRYYDPITRAYMFPLAVDSLSIARDGTLIQVGFTLLDGRRLATSDTLQGQVRPSVNSSDDK